MKTILLAMLVLGALGGLFGALLAFASKIFHVEVDPKQAQIRSCLAGANCGGCGYPGCDGYAAAGAAGPGTAARARTGSRSRGRRRFMAWRGCPRRPAGGGRAAGTSAAGCR